MAVSESRQEPKCPVKGHWTKARARLFSIIEDLVKWENCANEMVLNAGREMIRQSWRDVCELNKRHPQATELFDPDKLPGLHDPFAGGGSIPLEAQHLGLDAYASDLKPVAVLINKAMIEIPPRFTGKPPVNPQARKIPALIEKEWIGASGLAEDVRYYGQWIRDESFSRIGHLYPSIEVTNNLTTERPDLVPYIGRKLTVIAWLWTRTVKSPNPAFSHVHVPLASTFVLGSKPGKEAYVQPVVENGSYRFTVMTGKPPADAKSGTTAGKRQGFRCLMSGAPISYDYIRQEGKGRRLGQKLMAVVVDGTRARVYLSPTSKMEEIASQAKPSWRPDCEMPKKHRNFQPPVYGMDNLGDLFSPRQLVAMTTFSDMVTEAQPKIYADAVAAGLSRMIVPLKDGGNGAKAYAEAVSVYLAFAQSKACNRNTMLCIWESRMDRLVATFGRQALPMVWDSAETNPFAGAGGDMMGTVESVCEVIEKQFGSENQGHVSQATATAQTTSRGKFVSTDPPYYDNICYADLSDFFYVWLRRTLRDVYPELLATIAVPKAEELVATIYRHSTKERAEKFFLDGMTEAMRSLATQAHPAAPITIYYAFKQSETESDGTNSTGWETFLDAVIQSGLGISGTWPMRTEQPKGLRAYQQNSLASSIILVCRPRPTAAGTTSRRHFIRELNESLQRLLTR